MVLKGLITPGPTASHGAQGPVDPTTAGLRRVANRPIVCHVLDTLRRAGVREVALVAPDEVSAELQACVRDEGPADVASRCFAYEHDDSGGALGRAIEFLDDAPCVVHPPDGLLGQPLADFAELLRPDAADLVVLVARGPSDAESIGLATRRLLRMADPCSAPETALGPVGVYLFGVGALRSARQAGWRPEREADIVTVAERVVAQGGAVQVGVLDSWRRYAGKPADLLDMNRIALDALHGQPEPVQGERNRIEGPVRVHPSAHVQSSVIIGPTIIGPEAMVVESYIGPYTSIGAHAHIEGAEVERSIILAGASIIHVGGRLVASVVGRDARVARDFSLPRAMRLNVGDGGEVVLC